MGKQESEEVTKQQLNLATREGRAYRQSVDYMIDTVAHTGGTQDIRDMVIGFAQEPAEGLWTMSNQGDLEWTDPANENAHIEVMVMDADDNRFLPYCDVNVTIYQDDKEIVAFDAPFVWHPALLHYGKNVALPESGMYDIKIRVDAPEFHRHDRENGERYTKPVEVVFENVDIATGQE